MKSKKSGKIVNISSIAGLVSKPGSGAYSTSKSGLIGLTRASALDLAPYNILVNALCPGPTKTDMLEEILSKEQRKSIKECIPLKRFATVEEIANFAVLLCSDLNTYITGQTIVVDGGSTTQ
jgi:NAD(P)-dependent dehydrogenase (short-subunit alcohol dehydrogenase family)